MLCTNIHPSSDLADLLTLEVGLLGVADADRGGTGPQFLLPSTAGSIEPCASVGSHEVSFFFNDASSCGAAHGSLHPEEAASQPGSITAVVIVLTVVQYG